MSENQIAIIAALEDEIRIVRSKMQTDLKVHMRPALIERGIYLGAKILLVQSGIGKNAMRAAAAKCIEDYKPAFCLHVGYCGGADPKLSAGDVVIASHIADQAGNKKYLADVNVVARAEGVFKSLGLRFFTGGLVTVDKAVATPHEKAFVGTEYEVIGIDMESSSLAAVCEENGVPFLVVRAVLDPMDVSLPAMGDSLGKDGRVDPVALAEHIVKRPKDALALPRLAYFAVMARASLTSAIDGWLLKTREVT